jgi:mannose-6-phosphate isomerase-like protein (cupin superfamily)
MSWPVFTFAEAPEIRTLGGVLRSSASGIPSARIRFAQGRFLPGERIVRHYHKISEEIYYVVSGRCDVSVGDQIVSLAAGQALLVPPYVPHDLHNPENTPCELLFMISPNAQDDLFFTENDARET